MRSLCRRASLVMMIIIGIFFNLFYKYSYWTSILPLSQYVVAKLRTLANLIMNYGKGKRVPSNWQSMTTCWFICIYLKASLRGLDGHGHFKDIFTSFTRRAMFKNIDFKVIEITRIFSLWNNSLWPKISHLKFKADLMVTCSLLTTQPPKCRTLLIQMNVLSWNSPKRMYLWNV